MSPEEIAELPDVPNRRIPTLAASALVMSRVLRKLKPDRVAFSAYGLREGWLYKQLDEHEQYRDPLIESAMAISLPFGRIPAFSEALADWTANIFPGETQQEKRLRLTACALTDIAWREHEKIRANDSFMRLLQFPFIGLSHPERAFISASILARYGGKVDDHIRSIIGNLLTESELRRAEILGRTLLLGHRFSASVPEILAHARVRIDIDAVRLEILDAQSIPDSDAVQTRLRQLAKAAGVDNIEIVDVEK
jgi:exopolyphosphatase/guanosine-5'-triphosphate,3'-diphosphate pyrophosphatase